MTVFGLTAVALPFVDTVLPEAIKRDMGVIAMKVYAHGALVQPGGSGLQADEALGYALSLPGVSTTILGCSTPGEVDDNARIARAFAPFDAQTMQNLEQRTVKQAATLTAYKKSPFVSLD